MFFPGWANGLPSVGSGGQGLSSWESWHEPHWACLGPNGGLDPNHGCPSGTQRIGDPIIVTVSVGLYHQNQKPLYLIELQNVCIFSDGLCTGHVGIIFVIHSKVTNFARRIAMRSSWLKDPNNRTDIRYIFAVGLGSSTNSHRKIRMESMRHNDILQGHFSDTYRNLTLKTIMAFTWIKHNCKDVNWVFKTDDDVYVNTALLFSRIDISIPQPIMFGRCYQYHSPVIRHPSHRWYLSKDVYPNETFPYYCCGCGYVTSGHVVADLVDVMHRTPLIPFEDAFVGICVTALRYKVQFVGMGNMFIFNARYANRTKVCQRVNRMIAIHKVTSEDMEFYDKCKDEFVIQRKTWWSHQQWSQRCKNGRSQSNIWQT